MSLVDRILDYLEIRLTKRAVFLFCDWMVTMFFALVYAGIVHLVDGSWWMGVLLAHWQTASWYVAKLGKPYP